MSLLDPLIGVPNVLEVLASSSTSGAGGSVSFTPGAMLRKRSGKFSLTATVSATTAGGGTQGINLQFVSSLVGNIGPTVNYYGTSACGASAWVDLSGIDVGATIQYTLKVAAVSGSNSISVATGCAAFIVNEL